MADEANGAEDGRDGPPKLFEGMKFWLSRQVPQRSHFISQIKLEGGVVFELENEPGVIKLVDHVRKNLPPGSYSYKFIELSLRNKRLENLEDHSTGVGARHLRPTGSIIHAPKGTRTPFTPEDDQTLYDWIKPIEESGGSTRGNEIYKLLEAQYPRHTYQSWRDRWIKHVSTRQMQRSDATMGEPAPPSTAPTRAPAVKPTPNQEPPATAPTRASATISAADHEPAAARVAASQQSRIFTEMDCRLLMDAVDSIANVKPENAAKAWEKFAGEWPQHTADEWQECFETAIRPRYERLRQLKEKAAEAKRKREQIQSAIDQQTTSIQADDTISQHEPKTSSEPIVSAPGGSHAKEGQSISQQVGSKPIATKPNEELELQQTPRSPSFQPESPILSQDPSSQNARPLSNQARKRSTVRKVSNLDGSAASPPSRKRPRLEPEEDLDILRSTSRQATTNRLEAESATYDNQEVMGTPESGELITVLPNPPSTPPDEILARLANSSTPESEELITVLPNPSSTPPDEILARLANSSTPESHHDKSSSPLFIPEEGRNAPRLFGKTSIDEKSYSSPKDIRALFDEEEGLTFNRDSPGPSAQVPRMPSEELGDDTVQSEIRDSSNNLETAKEETEDNSDHFETAPQERIETQAILKQTLPELDLELPEPEGGWSAYDEDDVDEEIDEEVPEPHQQHTMASTTIPESVSDAIEMPSSPPVPSSTHKLPIISRPPASTSNPKSFILPKVSTIDEFIDTRLAHHSPPPSKAPEMEALLITAAKRTLTSLSFLMPSSFVLADRVFESLVAGKGVPDHVKGIWTEKDDHDLAGGDARGVDRVRKKHGDIGMEGRWDILNVLGIEDGNA